MKDFFIYFLLTIFYWSFRSTVMPGVPLPDLSLIIVFYVASQGASTKGVALAFLLGYLDDTFSGGVLGSSSFSLVFLFAAIHLLTHKVHFSTSTVRVAGAFVLCLIKGVAMSLALSQVGISIGFISTVIPTAFTTALFTPAIMALLGRLRTISLPWTQREGAA